MANSEKDDHEMMLCAWADYRKDYGLRGLDASVAKRAFEAGWKARAEDDSGPLR